MLIDFIFTLFNNWLFQGVTGGILATAITFPFVNGQVKKILVSRKTKRIENARQEIVTGYISGNIMNSDFSQEKLREITDIIMTKHNLKIKDIFLNDREFNDYIIKNISSIKSLNDETKHKLIVDLQNNYRDLFVNDCEKIEAKEKVEKEYVNINVDFTIDENYQFNDYEMTHIKRTKIFFCFIIFMILFFIISIINLLLKSYGTVSIIFLNIVITSIVMIPVLINGLLHMKEFDNRNKVFFYIIIFILILNMINSCFIIYNFQYSR